MVMNLGNIASVHHADIRRTNMKIFIIRLKRKWAYYVTQDMKCWEELYDLEQELKGKR